MYKDSLYEWYIKNRDSKIDDNHLEELFDVMIGKDKKLMDYIDEFRVVEESGLHLGRYSNYFKIITINLSRLAKINEKEQILYAIEAIRHEMEHAKNLKVLKEGKDDIESLIVNYSLKDFAIENNLDWHYNADQLDAWYLRGKIKENYKTDPGERLTEIKAWKYMVNLLKNQRRSDDLLLARKNLYYSYLRGYQDNRYYLESPTYDFLLKTGMLREFYWLRGRVDKKDYSFDTRLLYGLPLTTKEYENDTLQKVKLKKVKIRQ